MILIVTIIEIIKEKILRKEVKKMYDVTYSIDGVIKHISIKANDSIAVMNAITNMFGAGKVQIIDMRRMQKEGEKMEENKVIFRNVR